MHLLLDVVVVQDLVKCLQHLEDAREAACIGLGIQRATLDVIKEEVKEPPEQLRREGSAQLGQPDQHTNPKMTHNFSLDLQGHGPSWIETRSCSAVCWAWASSREEAKPLRACTLSALKMCFESTKRCSSSRCRTKVAFLHPLMTSTKD